MITLLYYKYSLSFINLPVWITGSGEGALKKGVLNNFLPYKREAYQRVGGEGGGGLITFSLGKRRAFQRGGAYLRGSIPANPHSTKTWRQPQKSSKWGTIFITGSFFFFLFHYFQCNNSTLSTN